jgi:hypothetical protein
VSLPTGPLLLVSPHLDDAILSCAALVERTEPIDVLTVCAGAPDPPRRGWWDEETGFASSAESIPARLAEDRAAFDATPHRLSYLGLFEGQYFDGERPAEDAETIRTAVVTWLAAQRGEGTVALPAGAGGRGGRRGRLLRLVGRSGNPLPHGDHVFVREAALGAPAPLLLYEELPYLFGSRADGQVRRVARMLGRRVQELTQPVDRQAKARRIAAYASQIPHISPDEGRLDDPAMLPSTERYWLLTPR